MLLKNAAQADDLSQYLSIMRLEVSANNWYFRLII